MENVQFEEQQQNFETYTRKPAFLPSLLIRYSRGKIETENQANLILLIVAVVIFSISMFIAFSGGTKTTKVPDAMIQASIEQMKNQKPPLKK